MFQIRKEGQNLQLQRLLTVHRYSWAFEEEWKTTFDPLPDWPVRISNKKTVSEERGGWGLETGSNPNWGENDQIVAFGLAVTINDSSRDEPSQTAYNCKSYGGGSVCFVSHRSSRHTVFFNQLLWQATSASFSTRNLRTKVELSFSSLYCVGSRCSWNPLYLAPRRQAHLKLNSFLTLWEHQRWLFDL